MSTAKNCAWQMPEAGQKSPAQELYEKCQENPTCKPGFDFDADDWFFCEYAPGKEQHVRRVHIHFPDTAGQQVRYLLKQYAAWRLGRVRPVTVRLELSAGLSHWLRYLVVRRITDPARFGAEELERFGQWLRMQEKGEKACERILHTVNRLLLTGQRLGWQVTSDELPKDIAYRMKTAEDGRAGMTQPIPVHIYDQILQHALHDETDEITRAGIIIQSQTGLRISEVLLLKENCLKRNADGSCSLAYSLKKTTKAEPEQRFCPANDLVIEAVGRLQTATGALRRESGRRELFLIRNHGIRQVSQTNWNRGRLQNFLRRWKITDESGGEYKLHSHQFRATYVREQLLAGGQIEQIRQRFGHVSSEMTARYVHISESEMMACLTPYMCVAGRCGK